MGSITAAKFVNDYGYIADGEKDSSVLYKKTEDFLSLIPLQPAVQPDQHACLFFDADEIPRLDTYEHRISAQPSYVAAKKFACKCYRGAVFEETIQKAIALFERQMQVAQDCITWKEGEVRSVQNIRDRTRRLQVLQLERQFLYAALKSGENAYTHFVAHLSTFQKVMYSVCSLFSGRIASFIIQEVPPLTMSAQEFSDQNPIIIPRLSLTLDENQKIDVILEEKVLQGIDLNHPLELGYRFGTLVTVKAAGTNKQLGQVSFSRDKNNLIAMIKPEDYECKKVLTELARYIFMRDPATTIHIRCGEQDTYPINIRKETVQDPTLGKCFKVSVFDLKESVLMPDSGCVPILPQGNDLPANDLTPHGQYQDAWTALKDLYDCGQKILSREGR
jgi:hypothetical protein